MKYVETGTDHYHSVGYEYDTDNNLTSLVETINGTDYATSYAYDDDNRLTTMTANGTTVEYTYDDYGRVTTQVTKRGETTVQTKSYTYANPSETTTSSQIATCTITADGYSITYTYSYDDNGNITSISDGVSTLSYQYDSANQLIRENNTQDDFTRIWTYDGAGNILTAQEYDYSTDELAEHRNTVNYAYGDSDWGDLLTAYDGQMITYDNIGNPLSDGSWSYTWEHGRQLAAMSSEDETWTYTYNSAGLRTKRTNGEITYEYVYNGSQLRQMTADGHTLTFTYDASGTPLTVTVDGTLYYYITNIQGDVVGLQNTSGDKELIYEYDAWGTLLYSNSGNTVLSLNPLRYRGYVYDTETKLYYLQSRYYDPALGRFLNADAFTSTGQGLSSNNMFTYCTNNPVNLFDPLGCWSWPTWEDVKDWLEEALDTLVQATVASVDPVGTTLIKELHYNRNAYNEVPQTEKDALDAGYTQVSQNDDKFHQNNQMGGRNKKYVSQDGHYEAVYYSNGQLNNTPEDQGTYNVFSANGNWCERNLGHLIFDVVPYMIWGNSPEDSTTIIDRIVMIFE